MSCQPSKKLELGSIRLKLVPFGVFGLASIIKLLVSSKMRSLFQKRNFGKVFGLVKRTDDLANQNRVKILKVPTGANSSVVMQSQILEFKSSLAEEHDIRNKIKLINLLTIQLRVLDSDKLGGDVINILDQHEDEVFTFLQ